VLGWLNNYPFRSTPDAIWSTAQRELIESWSDHRAREYEDDSGQRYCPDEVIAIEDKQDVKERWVGEVIRG
jgi:hypothetical protein